MAYIRHRKHSNPPTLSQGAAAALALMAIPAAVHAQQAPATTAPQPSAKEEVLPAVKVKAATENEYKADKASSPKFTQPLVDTPQTISVIKKEILQQQGATSLSDALRNTPGVTFQMGENGNTQTGDSIFMRGFDTSGSIFVDGMRDLGTLSRDTFNLEQVEVVKGPSGSDNGRGASSGYINLVSKTALDESFSNGSLTLGTADRKRATVDLNRPLDIGIPGSAVRLNLMAQDYGVPGRDFVKAKRWGFAPSLAVGLGTPTRTTLNYLHVTQKNRPDGGVSAYGLPGYLFGTTNSAGTPVDSSNYYGSLNDFDDVTIDMFTAKIEHDFRPGLTLRNTTRLGRSEQDLKVTGVNAVTATDPDPANYTVVRSRQGKHQNNEILTNQTNLTSEFQTGSVKHSLSTGLEFIYERQRTQNLTSNTTGTPANLYAPNVGDTFAEPTDNGAYTRGSTLSAAVYAFDTLKLSEKWLLNGGVRWEKFHTETNSATYSTATSTLTQNAPMSLTDNLFSWKLGAVYKPVPTGSIYVSVSNSFQPPGGANFALSPSSTNQASAGLDAQEGSNIELGTKWDLLGGKLAATAAIFRSENKKELVNDGGTPPVWNQIGKRRVDGVELGLVGQVTPAFNLSAGLAYMDPKIVVGLPTQTGLISFSPKVTFTSWATYKLPFGLTVGGGVRYVDTAVRSSNVSAANTNLLTIPDYWVADAMVSYDVNKNLSLQLNVYNLFDEDYITKLNNGGSRYVPGEKRNALLTANFRY
jgi:catecholate siderophore receptor